MVEPLPGDVEAEQPAGPEAVDALVRRRRRALVVMSLGLVAVVAIFLAALSVVEQAPPTLFAWILLGLVVVLAVGSLWPLRGAESRARWDERTRRLVRVETALRQHVSIGEEDRDAVTAAAQGRRSMAGAAWFGYPLLAVFVAFLLFNSTLPWPAALVFTLLAVVLCALGLLHARRRDREARRWLAEPLPPER
jgi:MFS family permease